MSFSHAGQWAGILAPNRVYSVYEAGTRTPATLYTDANKGTTAGSSVASDSDGNVVFYAAPGSYDLLAQAAPGRSEPPITVAVAVNPEDVGGGGGGPWGQASTAKYSGSGSPVGVVTPSGIGDLYVDDTTPALYQATGLTSADWQVQGGPSGQGNVVVRHFPFAYNSAGISTPSGAIPGFAIYTPTIGDILLDAWWEIDTAWNGTTPTFALSADFASGSMSGNQGDLAKADSGAYYWSTLLTQGSGTTLSSDILGQQGIPAGAQTERGLPAKFLTADPLKIIIGQSGVGPTALDPGATQGAGILYLVTATPA